MPRMTLTLMRKAIAKLNRKKCISGRNGADLRYLDGYCKDVRLALRGDSEEVY